MSEEWPQHPREPAAGGGDAEAPGADRPGGADEAVGNMAEDPAGLEHPTEPAVGGEGAERAQGAERAGDG